MKTGLGIRELPIAGLLWLVELASMAIAVRRTPARGAVADSGQCGLGSWTPARAELPRAGR